MTSIYYRLPILEVVYSGTSTKTLQLIKMEKRRLIIDLKSLKKDVVKAIHKKYPDGYENAIQVFKNFKGDAFKALEFETESTIFIIKMLPGNEQGDMVIIE